MVPEAKMRNDYGATRVPRPWRVTGVAGDEASLRQKVLHPRAFGIICLSYNR
jgi:hypothetical protein